MEAYEYNRLKNIRPRYQILLIVCILHFVAIFLLLLDMYLTFFTIYALIGWLCYCSGFSLLLYGFGIKSYLPPSESIDLENGNKN